jgi:hypothetical protein
MGPTQPPIQWVPGAISLGVKRLGSEADHSPTKLSWRGAELKHRDINSEIEFIWYEMFKCAQL